MRQRDRTDDVDSRRRKELPVWWDKFTLNVAVTY